MDQYPVPEDPLACAFDVALALVERPKAAGICLAQAEGLGNLCEVCLKGRRSDRLLRAWTNRRAVGPRILRVSTPRPSAWAIQIPGPSGRFARGCATSKLARRTCASNLRRTFDVALLCSESLFDACILVRNADSQTSLSLRAVSYTHLTLPTKA